MKKRALYFQSIIILSFMLSSCKLADIRLDGIKNHQTPVNKKGEDLLRAAHIKMGLDKLVNYKTYTIEYEEQYYGVGKFINKFNVNPVQLTIDYVPGNFIGKVTVKNGKKKGNQYYHNQGNTYYKTIKGREGSNDKIAKKWIHTHQYFLEFPLRIQEATAVIYAGETTIDTKEYDLILASWNTIEPQKEIDQYIIGINKETGFIDFIRFTVRDFAGFAVSTAKYNSFIEKEGVYFPSNISVHGKKYDSNKIYQMRVQELTFNKVERATITDFKK